MEVQISDLDLFLKSMASSNCDFDLARAYVPSIASSNKLKVIDTKPEATTDETDKLMLAMLHGNEKIIGQEQLDYKFLPSASIGFTLTLSLLKQFGRSKIYLQNPTFRRWQSIASDLMYDVELIEDVANIEAINKHSILVLTCPNSPFGEVPSVEKLLNLLTLCSENDVFIIFDFTGRYFHNLGKIDFYKHICNSNVEAIAIEDTGKTFPANGFKLAMLVQFNSKSDALKEFLFNTNRRPPSNSILTILKEVEEFNVKQSEYVTMQRVNQNRAYLIQTLPNNLKYEASCSTSCEIVYLPPKIEPLEVCKICLTFSVMILPDSFFYLNDKLPERRFIRIALVEDTVKFKAAIDSVVEVFTALK